MRGAWMQVSFALLAAAASSTAGPRRDELAAAVSRFAKLDGVRIHYKTLGRGKTTLVFVHGWSCNLDFWQFQAPLAGKAQLIFLDLPGHGASDKPEITYSQDLFARAVDAVLRDAKVERAVLVGHSNGTPVTRQFYRLYPSKVQALVVVDGSLRPFWKEKAQFDAFVSMFRTPTYQDSVSLFIDNMTAPARPELRAGIKSAMLATPQHVMLSSFEGIGLEELWKPDPILVPMLVLLAKSPFTDAAYQSFVKSLGQDVDYRVMEGVSHFLMMDKPGEFNAAVTDFLLKRKLLEP